MPFDETTFYKRGEDILAEMQAAAQSAIPDIYVGADGVLTIIWTVESGQLENAFLANQLLLEDMFVQTASLQALRQHGQQYGVGLEDGTRSEGTLTFSGAGGTYVPIGTQVGYDPGNGGEIVYFDTITDGTTPNPGDPAAPVAAVGTAGVLNGLYEYYVTFYTAAGESLPSPASNAVSPVNQFTGISALPIGGPGTIGRRLYRVKDGTGSPRLVVQIADNVTTAYGDNAADATVNANPAAPTVSTAIQITVNGQSEDVGIDKNLVAGAINIITNAPMGLATVTNPVPFTGGSDPEDSEQFRQKLLDNLRNARSASPDDIKFWAEQNLNVEQATVFTNNNLGTAQNGHTTVRLVGPNGSVPSAATISAVYDDLVARGFANITFHVSAFNAVATPVTVDVTPFGTYTVADVTPSVQQAVADYINGLAAGEMLYISGIITAVKPLTGILDVVVTVPATNQATAADAKRTPGTVTVI
jgi:uncharacterized phage protein gp47/JayE